MDALARHARRLLLPLAACAALFAASLPAALVAHAAAAGVPAAALRPMDIAPVTGYVGDTFRISAEGLPPGKAVDIQWATVDGDYATQAYPETIEFYERTFVDNRLSVTRATTTADGRLDVSVKVPDDYGEVHDIYAVVDGEDVARAGFRVLPRFAVSTLEGPVGTPITITANGIGWKNWESTWGVNYDNKYVGYITAITTRGSAVATIRAAGPVGKHTIDIWHAGQTVPYLNWEQSPQSHIPVFQYSFSVTSDGVAPPPTLDLAAGPLPAVEKQGTVRTTASQITATGNATVAPQMGPVASTATLNAAGLQPNAPASIYWMTARGSRTSGLGWGLAETPVGEVVADGAGTLTLPVTVPDDLGGWHALEVVQGENLAAETFFLVQPSLVTVTSTPVKAGDAFEVHLKGIGWTELDNIYGVTYDNSYLGFACGFNSNGDVTLNLRASGAPGVHLIDLYPAIYQGHGKPPWLYDTPMLTYATDHPSLAYGYHLPAFRLAITVVE